MVARPETPAPSPAGSSRVSSLPGAGPPLARQGTSARAPSRPPGPPGSAPRPSAPPGPAGGPASVSPLARQGDQVAPGRDPSLPGLPPPPVPLRPPPRRQAARPRVVQGRRTRRVVRRIDAWTVFKMSILFYLCVLLVVLIAGIVLWNIASAFNVIASIQKFVRSILDLQTFVLRPGVVLESTALGGVVLVLLGTGANVLAAVLYNLISDVVGGVQLIVLEEADPGAPGAKTP